MKGQTLVEVLVAMTVGVLVLTAITSSVLTSLVNSRISTGKVVANQYLQEGIEIARGYRAAAAGKYCLDRNEKAIAGIPENSCTTPNVVDGNNSFIRTVDVLGNGAGNDCGTNINKIVSTVKWTDSKCSGGTYCHQISVSSCANVIAAAGTITPTVTVTPTPTPIVTTLTAIADASVSTTSPNDPDYTTNSSGTFDRLYADGSGKNFLIKFDTAPVVGHQLVDATLRLTTRLGGEHYKANQIGNDWAESYVTYNNKPDTGAYLDEGASNGSSILSLDVTSGISQLGEVVSFLGSQSIGTPQFVYARESGATTPQLILKTNPGGGTLITPTVRTTNRSSCLNCSSLSYSHSSSGSSPTKILIVTLSFTGADSLVTSVKFGGTNLTKIDKSLDIRDNIRTQMWYLMASPAITANVDITLSSSSPEILSTTTTFNNVSTHYPIVDVKNSWTQGGSPLLTSTLYAASNDLIVSAHGVDCVNSISSLAGSAGQTETAAALLTATEGHIMTTKPGPSSAVGATWSGSSCSYGSNIAITLRGPVQ